MTNWLNTTVIFLVTGAVLSLFAWERLAEPSPHFHFVDLAHSFRQGRLDTDTPRKRWEDVAKQADAPRGYADDCAARSGGGRRLP